MAKLITNALTNTQRYPLRSNDPLQGYDAADELMIFYLQELELAGKRILIINDQFGALSSALQEFDCTSYTDSYVSKMAIENNSLQKIRPIFNLSEINGLFDLVLIRIPKNMTFFEDILCHLTQHLQPGSQLICGSMVKHLAPSSFELLQKCIGETTTSLAQKKARLVFATFTKQEVTSPYPLELMVDGFKETFTNGSNLFSREKLDIGTRFFLEHIPSGARSILDLGCANGIVGIKAKMLNPHARVTFSDESAMAVESTKINYGKYFQDEAEFIWTNCFENGSENAFDLILCNPPFHQGHTIGDFIAWQMFQDAYRCLKPGGTLRVIGNSHLGYQLKQKKLFGNSKIVATNAKFIISDAIK